MNNQKKTVPQILIIVFSTYERTGWYHPDLAAFLESLRENRNYATLYSKAHNFIPIDGGRNTAANNYKGVGADWLLMIDNDMSPPLNILDCIKDAPEDAAVVVPKFYLWDEDKLKVKLCWGMQTADGGDMVNHLEPGWHELTHCGTGLIFIRPEVFQKVPAPWFWRTYDEMVNMQSTEDINFAHKVREHGFKIYGNGKYEVGHHHTCNLSAVNRAIQQARMDGYRFAEAEFKKQAECPSAASCQDDQVSPTGNRSSASAMSPIC
jgi:hypothetical protein